MHSLKINTVITMLVGNVNKVSMIRIDKVMDVIRTLNKDKMGLYKIVNYIRKVKQILILYVRIARKAIF